MENGIFHIHYVGSSIPETKVDEFFDIVKLVHRMIFVDKTNNDINKPYMKNPVLNQELTNLSPLNRSDQDIKYSYVINYDTIARGVLTRGQFEIELSRLIQRREAPYEVPIVFKMMDIIAGETFWLMNTKLHILFKESIHNNVSRLEKYLKVWFNIPKNTRSVLKFYQSRNFIQQYYDNIPHLVRSKVHRLLLPEERLSSPQYEEEDKENDFRARHPFLQLFDNFIYSTMITTQITNGMYDVFYNPDKPISDEDFF
jgi:hypothetical protein